MKSSKEVAVKGDPELEPKSDVAEDSDSNLNITGIFKDTDNTNNLNINTHQKSYEAKISLPNNLNVDPQNYMRRTTRDNNEEMHTGRTRSNSFSNGTAKSEVNQLSSSQESTPRQQSNTSSSTIFENLDSFFSKGFNNTAESPEPAENEEPKNSTPIGCSRTISYHNYLCSCDRSCCCRCDNLFPLELCKMCLEGVCIHLTTPHSCKQPFDLFPSLSTLQEKVSSTPHCTLV